MDCHEWIAESELRDLLFHANEAMNPQITFAPGDSEADLLRKVVRSMMDSVYIIQRMIEERGISLEDR
jgi:hypothetical protein